MVKLIYKLVVKLIYKLINKLVKYLIQRLLRYCLHKIGDKLNSVLKLYLPSLDGRFLMLVAFGMFAKDPFTYYLILLLYRIMFLYKNYLKSHNHPIILIGYKLYSVLKLYFPSLDGQLLMLVAFGIFVEDPFTYYLILLLYRIVFFYRNYLKSPDVLPNHPII